MASIAPPPNHQHWTIMSEERLANHEDFMNFNGLQELLDHYKSKGFQGSDNDLVAQARQDWRACGEELAKQIAESGDTPDHFRPIEVQRNDKTYIIYGLIHGYVGGHGDYHKFVAEPIGEADFVVFENQLNYFYKHKAGTVIPDFMVLGVAGSLILGLQVGLFLPLHLWALVTELLGFAEEFDTEYHALDAETRRAIDIDPPLPSRIEIDIGMKYWDKGIAGIWGDPYAIVPRSLYMAGFCEGVTESRNLEKVSVVVGDFHAMEMQRFLEGRFVDHALFKAGKEFGQKTGWSYKLAFHAHKLGHLCLAGFGGMISLMPLIILISYFLF